MIIKTIINSKLLLIIFNKNNTNRLLNLKINNKFFNELEKLFNKTLPPTYLDESIQLISENTSQIILVDFIKKNDFLFLNYLIRNSQTVEIQKILIKINKEIFIKSFNPDIYLNKNPFINICIKISFLLTQKENNINLWESIFSNLLLLNKELFFSYINTENKLSAYDTLNKIKNRFSIHICKLANNTILNNNITEITNSLKDTHYKNNIII